MTWQLIMTVPLILSDWDIAIIVWLIVQIYKDHSACVSPVPAVLHVCFMLHASSIIWLSSVSAYQQASQSISTQVRFKEDNLFFSSSATMWSSPWHASPDPAVGKKGCQRGSAGGTPGWALVDKELFSACPHLRRHQVKEEPVEVRQNSLLKAAVDKTTGRGGSGGSSVNRGACTCRRHESALPGIPWGGKGWRK